MDPVPCDLLFCHLIVSGVTTTPSISDMFRLFSLYRYKFGPERSKTKVTTTGFDRLTFLDETDSVPVHSSHTNSSEGAPESTNINMNRETNTKMRTQLPPPSGETDEVRLNACPDISLCPLRAPNSYLLATSEAKPA